MEWIDRQGCVAMRACVRTFGRVRVSMCGRASARSRISQRNASPLLLLHACVCVCVNRSFCLSVNGRRIQCLPPARYTVALMDRMLNRCVFLCTRVRVCVWDGERMCWALLAADLEELQLHWKGLMLLGFLSCVCVICMCTFEELRMIVHEGTFAPVSRNPCCVSLWSVFSLMWC